MAVVLGLLVSSYHTDLKSQSFTDKAMASGDACSLRASIPLHGQVNLESAKELVRNSW